MCGKQTCWLAGGRAGLGWGLKWLDRMNLSAARVFDGFGTDQIDPHPAGNRTDRIGLPKRKTKSVADDDDLLVVG